MTEKSFWSEFLISQVLGKVNTISVEKTDGCQMFINQVGKWRIQDHDFGLFVIMKTFSTSDLQTQESIGVEIVSAKSSEMNVVIPVSLSRFLSSATKQNYAHYTTFSLRTETTWWSSQSQSSSRRQSTARSSSPRPLRVSRERLRRPLPSLHFQRLDPDFDTCNVSTCPALPAPRFVGDCLELCALRMIIRNCRW